MRATFLATSVGLVLGLGAAGGCAIDADDSRLGDNAAGIDDGSGDDGSLDGDFGGQEGDPDASPTDPDDHSGGGPDLDIPGDDVPLEVPHDIPFGDPDDHDDCIPSGENCDNGVDDDCDGLVDGVDPDCASCTWNEIDCSDVELVGHCNSHLGDDIDECYAAGNPGNCDDVELYAWCSRRVYNGVGSPWDDYIRNWVDDRCAGTVLYQARDGEDWYVCSDEPSCTFYECKTPLVLQFDAAAPVVLRPDDGSGSFDLSSSGDGSATRTDWPTSATPWLTLDRDGDGLISAGAELFGSATPMPAGEARNGFEPLALLDETADGLLDGCDPMFERLRVWTDANQDRVSQPDELRSLAELGVLAIELDFELAARCDERGNCERERSRFTWRGLDGALHEGAVIDVHLVVRP